MADVSIEHTICFRTAAGEEFGREFEVTMSVEWCPDEDCFDLTWLESDGVVITPSYKDNAAPEEACLWDRCRNDLREDADLIGKAWMAYGEGNHETEAVA